MINPAAQLPQGLDAADAPVILITTNRADPLHDEGVDLVEKLKKCSANVIHFDHKGSHTIGTTLNSAAMTELTKAWGDTIFG